MRISDWISDVCSSDLCPEEGRSEEGRSEEGASDEEEGRRQARRQGGEARAGQGRREEGARHEDCEEGRQADRQDRVGREEGRQGARPAQAGCCREAGQGPCGSEAEAGGRQTGGRQAVRSEEHTSELQSLLPISSAVF